MELLKFTDKVIICRFEKCIGGKYLGSVLSIALAALARDGLFPAAPQHNALETADLSLFEESVPTLPNLSTEYNLGGPIRNQLLRTKKFVHH